ncbi:MAG: hypothetical protein P8J68_01925 [Arenicellaceae bacterium]|nr:hypothetical protein [Arenicellaceae bacterium]
MYSRRLIAYLSVIALCVGCNYISDAVSGGGQDGVDTAKESKESNAISLSAIKEALETAKDPDVIVSSEPAGSLQGSAHVAAVNNIAAQFNARPKILYIVDDWGNTCAMQNSQYCEGYGVALVPADDGNINGLACGPGTAAGQMVVNYEWVSC